jgi:ABC-type lipoprotein export system ATPase subunit
VVVVSHRPGASTSADQSIHMEHGAITSCTRAIVHQP